MCVEKKNSRWVSNCYLKWIKNPVPNYPLQAGYTTWWQADMLERDKMQKQVNEMK